jgi:hypothetical protein
MGRRQTTLQVAYATFLAILEGSRCVLGPRAWAVFVDMAGRRLKDERCALAPRLDDGER